MSEEARFPKLREVIASRSGDLPQLTRDEVANHTGPPVFEGSEVVPGTEPYIIIHNKVYDVTHWLNEHPGGEQILLANAGCDATESYEVTDHSEKARIRRETEFLVGELVPEDRTEVTTLMEDPEEASKAGSSTRLTGAVVVVLLAIYGWFAMKSSRPLPAATYSRALRHVHLLMALGTFGAIGTVQAATRSDGAARKNYLTLHKQTGVLLLFAVIARIWLRLQSAVPPRFPAPRPLQNLEGLSHRALYLILLAQPISGIAWHYYVNWTAESNEENDKAALKAISFHKKLGRFVKYAWLPFHILVTAYHLSKGRGVVRRISPFI